MSEQIRVVDLFAGAGGLSTGVARALLNYYREPIAAATGLAPEEVQLGDCRVQQWLAAHVDLHAVNHWEPAIQTHEENLPWAEHYHAKIQELHPPDVVEPGTVKLFTGGPECTHFSTARGGKPINEQKRASAWDVLEWIEKLRPDNILLENVKEFRQWGPIDDDGQPTRDGTIFQRWVGMLEAFGYSVVYDEADEDYGVVLNAADYGEAQSRERLFIMASREKRPTPPEPTHSADDPDKPDRRTAADIIDWSDLGTSIWTRDLELSRVQPLSSKTMARIAEGIRRHCDDRLSPLADALETLDADELQRLRENVVPAEHAGVVANAVDEPFLVHYSGGETSLATPQVLGQHSNSVARDVDERPVPTITKGGKIHLTAPESFCLRQQSGGVPFSSDDPFSTVSRAGAIGLATAELQSMVLPRDGAQRGKHSNPAYPADGQPFQTITAKNHDGHLVTPTLIHYSHGGALKDVDDPLPTVATERGGAFGLSRPFLAPLYSSRAAQRPRTRSVDRPFMTVPGSKSPSGVATPFLRDYHGNSSTRAVDEPFGTIETKDRYALCVPEHWPWGLDVRYRMIQPRELKQAQGFPESYEITGSTKKEVTAQIGNAVPVHLAQALARHLLEDETPSLSNYGGGLSPEADASVPEYEEVAGSDD